MRTFVLFFILFVSISSELFAQWECPSQLSAFLKPIGKSKFYLGSEFTGGVGYLHNNTIANSLGYIGLDRSGERFTVYLEGGFKFWQRTDLEHKNKFSNHYFGMRELFFQYRSSFGKFTVGLHSARLDDDYLLNERVIGISYKQSQGPWSVNVSGGTVTKDFARNGIFCAVGYLYDIIPGRSIALLGNKPGQTNFTGATIRFLPSKITKIVSETSSDEFTMDDFSETKEAEATTKYFSVESIGAALYSEFGSWVKNTVYMGGLFSESHFPAEFIFKPQLLYQASPNNRALIYVAGLEKSLVHTRSKTDFYFRYYGITAIDANAVAGNSFSNIFAGQVLRLDVLDMPFAQFAIRYRIPSIRTHLKLQVGVQTKTDPMQELDLGIEKKFGKHFQVSLIGGLVKSPMLKKDAFLGRAEMRVGF